MRTSRTTLAFITALVLTSGVAHGAAAKPDALPRRASLGVLLGSDAATATTIKSINPGSAALDAQLRAGDVIEALDGQRVSTGAEVQAAIGKHRGGDTLEVDLRRDGKSEHVAVVLKSFPSERIENARVEYGHVTIEKGIRLRTILSVPLDADATHRAPAALFLQGGSCNSIAVPWAGPTGPNELLHTVASHGFVTLRVEKPGVAESEGPPCATIGYQLELEGYRAALRELASNPAVDRKRIFVVGVSLGGFFAPVVARDAKIAGIAVYGTIAFSPTPYPGRGELFFREIAEVDILRAWASVNTRVLVLHGEYDDRTTASDHEKIARIVNERHPGYAEHRELARLDHCWTRHATLEASQGKCGNGEETRDLSDAVMGFLKAHS
jgi:dienelactone hydrolase